MDIDRGTIAADVDSEGNLQLYGLVVDNVNEDVVIVKEEAVHSVETVLVVAIVDAALVIDRVDNKVFFYGRTPREAF
ncbi:hypothetical protein NDU88_007801 [Pleurodeles waltl]|uniref:Uncharacterized protein n=1 Tax=Pleurodeles waltl TaxID=8319 RepID=A0AAV7VQR5_PLEWA|nr:hypothetical protein NDU88_007801 [Pleurodeles waltl]